MAESFQIVADLKIGKVDASSLASALNTEVSKSAGALSGGGKGANTKAPGGGGDIALLLQAALGESFNELVSILQGIAKILLTIVGTGIAIKIIADIISAFWNAFQPMTKVWTAVLNSITKMVEPFANLLIPLMLPFLYLMTNVARILNVMLLPVFTLLMKAFSGIGQGTQQAVQQMFAGDIGGAINTMLTSMGEAFNMIRSELIDALLPILKLLASWVLGILSIDTKSIGNTLKGLLGDKLGGAAANLITFVHNVSSALAGFVASVLGGASLFNQVFGKDAFENIVATNEGFKFGVSAGDVLKLVWNWLLSFFGKLSSVDLGKTIVDLADLLSAILIPAFDVIGGWLNKNKDSLVAAFASILDQLPKWTEIVTNLAVEMNDFLNSIWPNLSSSLKSLSDAAGSLADIMDTITKNDLVGTALNTGASVIGNANPIFAGAKQASQIASGASTLYNVYVNGNGDRFLEDKIKTTMEDIFSRQSRTGYFQKGY